jgi:hypothetical protein
LDRWEETGQLSSVVKPIAWTSHPALILGPAQLLCHVCHKFQITGAAKGLEFRAESKCTGHRVVKENQKHVNRSGNFSLVSMLSNGDSSSRILVATDDHVGNGTKV